MMEQKYIVGQWFFAAVLLIVLALCLVVSVVINVKIIDSRQEAPYFSTSTAIMATNAAVETCAADRTGNPHPCPGMWVDAKTWTPTMITKSPADNEF
jgi:hypothetical protein